MLSLLLALAASQPALAVEVTGQIRGQVVDPSGIGVPGLTVTVTSPALMGTGSATTDDEGYFRVVALPPGQYVAEVKADGFFPYKATGLFVVTGQSAEITIELQPASGAATVTVVAQKPVVDTRKTSSGAVLSRESMRDIPNGGRDYQSLTGFAAGVVGSGNANVRGSFDDGNQFYLDGVNNTDPITGTFSQNMNYDAIEEVQVVTGGMDAEYGRSLGGAVNVVTRSGGNEFHGDAQFLYSSAPATGDKGFNLRWAKPLEGEVFGSYQNQGLALNLGGPIVRDRLWFFASLQGDYLLKAADVDPSIGRPADQPLEPRDWKSAYWFGKLTWQPGAQNKLTLQAQGDPTWIKNVEQNGYVLPNGESNWRQGGFSITAGHILTPTARTVIQTQAYFQKSDLIYYAKDCESARGDEALADCIRNLEDPWSSWYPDDFSAGDAPYGEISHRYRSSLQTNWTQFFSLLGEHQTKIGAQGEYLVTDDIFPGIEDWTFKQSTGDPADIDSYENLYQIRYDNEQEIHLTGMLVSAYVQDIWNPIPRLTIRPGVRMDYSALNNDVGELAFSKTTFAPRMGLAGDLTGDGKTSGHAFYGRFYDSGFLAVSSMLGKRSTGYERFAWDSAAGEWGEEPVESSASYSVVSDDLKNPYSDEFDVGISRDLGAGWAVDVTGTYEYAQNFWEDDEVNLIWNDDGTDVVGYRNGKNESIYRIRTPDDSFTEYTGLELSVARQFSDGFSVLGSYTWSRAYGTNSAQFASGAFDNPEQAEEETGLLSYDHTHSVKLIGSMRDPDAIKLSDSVQLGYLYGWNFYILSGSPYTKAYYNSYYGGWYNYEESVDGTYRTPAMSQLDIKLGLTLAVKQTTWDLTAEIFNLFNDRAVESVETTYDDGAGGIYLDENGDPIFGTPVTRQSPRYVQLGLRGEF